MTRWLSALGIATLAVASGAAQGPPRAPLFLAVSIGEYLQGTYTERPASGADFVFFTGEPIGFKVVAMNRAAPRLTLKFETRADGAVYAHSTTKNQEAFPISVSVTTVSIIVDEVNTFEMSKEELFNLEFEDRAQWDIVVNERLDPGVYRLQTGLWAKDTQGRQIAWQSNEMGFEVRSASKYPAEVLLREAYRHTGRERDLGRAESAVRKLLTLNPTSSAARHMLAMIEDARGNTELARRYRAMGREIADKDLDVLLNQYCNRQCRAAFVQN